MSKDNSGSAFPTDTALQTKGMTLRDYLAAKAMQGMLVNGPERGMTSAFLASESYRVADAMLEERMK